eukprot:TRINITY_DN22022_c0_g1_i2.p1 TRINITY_DN22022_c0_g1~~TRINITY_DN22022_c0_g1_i2.p1  ORF type:complete len:135 (-),score=46.91 TRINITY_DN22022_c0_g1_i2:46-450(-)
MIRRPPRSTLSSSSAASDVYKRQVAEYIHILYAISSSLHQLNVPSPMLVLAAAVSDYYLPFEDMAVHKISGGDGLTIQLKNVPKALGVLAVSYTHLRAHETPEHLVCRLLLEKKKKTLSNTSNTRNKVTLIKKW